MAPLNRRRFLKTGSIAAAAAYTLPRFSIGRAGPSANSRLNIAVVGAGNIARMTYADCADEEIVALCDVDSRQFSMHDERFPGMSRKPKFADFRRMYDRLGSDIDAVCINTPDHTHFNATLEAMQRGLHVCTQKPLTHNIWQARTLRKAKERYGVVTNMANQGHTYDGIRAAKEIYEANLLGQVSEVHCGFPGPDWRSRYFRRPQAMPLSKQAIPAELDWDLWLGPQEARDFNSIYHPLTWRGFDHFGTGQFGDWFCHIGDGPVWILDLYEPTVIECIERGPGMEGMIPDWSVVRFDFPARGEKSECSLYWYDGTRNGGPPLKTAPDWSWGEAPIDGSTFFGDKESLYLDRRSNNPRFARKQRAREYRESGDVPQRYERVEGGPYREWIRAIKGEGPEPGSNFDYAAPLTEVALIGVLAQRFGGRIEWDAKSMRILNRPELNAFVKEPVRPGWESGETLWD